MTTTAPPDIAAERGNRRRILFSGFLGTSVEYYDFLLYAQASAVIFPTIFFPNTNPLVGALLSFATLAVGYFARPIGGLIFGHFGDRFGRKRILVITLSGMGITSFLVGLVPSYASIGVAAPVILVVLRILQGIALGGEWGGATTLSMESSPAKSRGWAASVALAGGPCGAVIANLALALFALVPGGLAEGLGGWAWRIPFLLSAVLVILGLVLRIAILDSPEYRGDDKAVARAPKFPLGEVIVHYPKQTIAAILGGLAPLFMQGLMVNWMLSYAKGFTIGDHIAYTQAEVLWLSVVANTLNVFTLIGFAALSDRLGRKKVLVTGAIAGMVLTWPTFLLVQAGTWWGLVLGLVLGAAVIEAWTIGPLSGWIGEKFPTTARYTGVSLSYQVASTLGAGLAPLTATALVAAGSGSTLWIVLIAIALSLVSGLAYLFSRETYRSELPTARQESAKAVDLPALGEPVSAN